MFSCRFVVLGFALILTACSSPEEVEDPIATMLDATTGAAKATVERVADVVKKIEIPRADFVALSEARAKAKAGVKSRLTLADGRPAECDAKQCVVAVPVSRQKESKGVSIQLNGDLKMELDQATLKEALEAIARSAKTKKPELTADKSLVCDEKLCHPKIDTVH